MRPRGWVQLEIAMERLCLEAMSEGRPFTWIRFCPSVDGGTRKYRGQTINFEVATAR